MNTTDPESALYTEQIQRVQKEVQPTPKPLESVLIPETKREERSAPENLTAADELQPGTPSLSSELTFVCVLIPRFSDHYLMGDMAEELVEWMKQICVSYGWRLDAISIRPGYLQWVMIVPLNANPAHFMRLVRRHTSERIFEDFPRFKQKNLSGEFWAPGNFVVAGNQLQSSEVVNNFILQTRRHQGII